MSDMQWPHDTLVCIPAYKACESLRHTLPAIIQHVPLSNIIVIDDGSLDGTQELCRSESVAVITQPINQGKGAALIAGFQEAFSRNARWVITMDADGQHAPEDLPNFVREMQSPPDAGIIIGARNRRIGIMPIERIFSNSITSGILSLLTHQKILDSQCGYRAYSCAFLRRITIQCRRFDMESEVILKAAALGFPIRFTAVHTLYLDGSSHISLVTDTLRWVRSVLTIWLATRKRHGIY